MRVRTTAASLLVVGLALVVAAIVMLFTLRSSLEDGVEAAARLRATEVAASLASNQDPSSLVLADGDDAFVQVVDDSGRVVAASAKVSGSPPLADLPLRSRETLEGIPREPDDRFMLVSKEIETTAGTYTIIVGRGLDPVEESGAIVTRLLVFGIPLLLAVVALTTWGVVGRALRFVESIRKKVAEISSSELHQRVPDPPGDDEIARLAETMNAMLARLESEQQRQRRFISDASHELRSPVATIRNQAEVALAYPDRTELQELASEVLAEDLRLERLVEDLLALARSDERRNPFDLRPTDLDDVVLDEGKRLRDSTTLHIDTADVSGGRTRGDSAQLRRAVRNLADNAARHASSAVKLTLREEGDWVVLLIDDDGPGVAAEDREIIFQRFTRLDDARDRGHGGAGLGLAIVFDIVRGHGGIVTVGVAPLGGARFEIRLPIAR